MTILADLIEMLAHLDWFERVDELARMMCGIRSWRFSIPRTCGWSGHHMEQMLRRYGIKIWGRNFNQSHLFFRVKLQQANWAEYLLWRNGIPVHSRPFNPQNRIYGMKHAPGSKPPRKRGIFSL